MRYEKSCGALIYRIFRGSLEVLLVRQFPGGHWAFPKGHMEANEKEIETAMREVQEETGLSVSIDQGFRKSVTYLVAPNVEKEVVYFAAIPLTSIIHRQISEIQDIQWTTFPEALNKVTFKNDRGTLLALEDYLKRS